MNKTISLSQDGRLLFWELQNSSYMAIKEEFIDGELISARYLDSLMFMTITTRNSALIYDIKDNNEILRVNDGSNLKDAVLVNSKGNVMKLILYTWNIENTVTAWKIVGSAQTFFTFSTEPIFTIHSTIFPKNIVNDSGFNLSIFNFTKASDIDALTGHVIRNYSTRSREAIVDGCQAIAANGNSSILFATRTTLFLDSECISYGGSLGDEMQIENCAQYWNEKLIAYTGVEWDSSQIPSILSEKACYSGVLVIIAYGSEVQKKRICSLRHSNSRIIQWEVLGGKRAVTIASDNMVRLWDIYEIWENVPGRMLCCFPIRGKVTSMTISTDEDNGTIILVGDENGEVLALKIEEPTGMLKAQH